MQLQKYHPHGTVLFATFSLEEGLLLLSNPLCEAMIKSCLARAFHKHPVSICHFIVQATHVHLVLVVEDPDDVYQFIGHFKRETAHGINRLLGRSKRTVWCEGYDSPVVLTPIRALMCISYLYANPAKDNLEDSIDSYPGLSSWKMFLDGNSYRIWQWLRRPVFKKLSRDSHSLRGYTKEAKELLSDAKKSHEFTIKPNAWLDAFGITSEESQAKWNRQLIERVRTIEDRARRVRARTGMRVMGKQRLLNQILDASYRPQRSGKRMHCLSEVRQERIDFIEFLKSLYSSAKEVRQRWRSGDFSVPYPLGLYPPSMPKLAEPLGMW